MLKILEFPDPKLREKSAPVVAFGQELDFFARSMIEAMDLAEGVGLAAIQVGRAERLLVMRCAGAPQSGSMVICNPEIVSGSGESNLSEGCLSAPGVYERLTRHQITQARWQDETGAWKSGIFEGLASVCLQHEMDHLDGKIFFEALSPLRASRARERFFKLKKERVKRDVKS